MVMSVSDVGARSTGCLASESGAKPRNTLCSRPSRREWFVGPMEGIQNSRISVDSVYVRVYLSPWEDWPAPVRNMPESAIADVDT